MAKVLVEGIMTGELFVLYNNCLKVLQVLRRLVAHTVPFFVKRPFVITSGRASTVFFVGFIVRGIASNFLFRQWLLAWLYLEVVFVHVLLYIYELVVRIVLLI